MRIEVLTTAFILALISSAVLAQPPLKSKLDRAEVMVAGEVDSVESAKEFAPRSISEHNPDWRWAEVKVSQTLKGKRLVKNGKIRFLFPASLDIAWADYPKFKFRDRGIFILTVKKMNLSPIPQRPEVKVNTMTVLLVAEQGDFQPMERLNEM